MHQRLHMAYKAKNIYYVSLYRSLPGTCLVVQWLGLHGFSAMGPGSIPGWGTKISQATRHERQSQRIRNAKSDTATAKVMSL